MKFEAGKGSRGLLLVTALLPAIAGAQQTEPEAGFSGEVSLFLGASRQESNFNTDNDVKPSPLNSSGDSDTQVMIFPLGELKYRFGDQNQHQLFAGTSRDDIVTGIFALELGYSYQLSPRSDIALSLLPSVVASETWADPFVEDSPREETDISGNAYRLNYRHILNSPVSVQLAYFDREVDKELSGKAFSGDVLPGLNREGDGIYGRLAYGIRIGEMSSLEPFYAYTGFDADGDAMSSDQHRLGLTYQTRMGQHGMAVTIQYATTDYDAEHPVFGATREDDETGINLAYFYGGFLGVDQLGFAALLGYTRIDSNIEFYDESSVFAGTGVTWEF